MNSDPNSDLEQCTESKLGRVHKVHTQRTLIERTLRPGLTHTARWAPCLGVHWRYIVDVPSRVTGRVTHASCRVVAPSDHDTKMVSQPKPCRTPCRSAAAPCHNLSAPYRDTKRSLPAKIQNLYSDSPHGKATPARLCGQAGLVVALAGHVVGPCHRVAGRIVAPCCMPLRPVSRYNLLYRDSY